MITLGHGPNKQHETAQLHAAWRELGFDTMVGGRSGLSVRLQLECRARKHTSTVIVHHIFFCLKFLLGVGLKSCAPELLKKLRVSNNSLLQ